MVEVDAPLNERLRSELVIWLTTVRADGQPQSVPVWFVWQDDSFLLYSQPDKPKLRNIERNPRVSLHLRGSETGGDVVVFEGRARRASDAPAADRVEPYIEKYVGQIESLGWAPSSFARDYSEPVRITPTALRVWE